MRPVHTDCLPIAQATDVLPDNLLISERGPAMCHALLKESLDGATLRCNEKRLSSNRVVVGDRLSFVLNLVNPSSLAKSIARVLRIVTIEAADAVSCFEVTAVS